MLEFLNKNRGESWNIKNTHQKNKKNKKKYSRNLNILEIAFVKKIRICNFIYTVKPNYMHLKCDEFIFLKHASKMEGIFKKI